MQVATTQPHPYLLNQAGGVLNIKEFSLVSGQLNLVPASDEPLTGSYQLVYRCPDHQNFDIKRAVSSDGTKWTIAEALVDEDNCDVCYPGPCN